MDQVPGFIQFLKGMPRPETDEYFLLQALMVSTRATCSRRRVGCVLVDVNNKVIATGYNGVAAGLPHCTDVPCPGANQPSGQGLALCEAIHAEENALIQCTRPNEIHTVYCVASPCIHCIRKLRNTGAKRIVFAEIYPHPESEPLWTSKKEEGRTWMHLPWDRLPSIANTRLVPLGPGASTLIVIHDRLGTATVSLKMERSPGSKTPSS